MRRIDISGERFGKLLAIERSGDAPDGQSIWRCLCDCGNETFVRVGNLRSGSTKSCGCARILHGSEAPNWKGGHRNFGSIAWCNKVIQRLGDYADIGGHAKLEIAPELLAEKAFEWRGQCDLCGEIIDASKPTVDHDHATGDFRGFLCNKCNIGLSFVEGKPQFFNRIKDYLWPESE